MHTNFFSILDKIFRQGRMAQKQKVETCVRSKSAASHSEAHRLEGFGEYRHNTFSNAFSETFLKRHFVKHCCYKSLINAKCEWSCISQIITCNAMLFRKRHKFILTQLL